jgi:SAM-dependent methyltransferase
VTGYLSNNRELWDEWAVANEGSDYYDLPGFVRDVRAGRDRMREFEAREVGPVRDRSLLHLQCHIGLDSLSWARRGARVTAVDFSSRALARTGELAGELGLDVRLIESDVYELPGALDEQFDVVYTSHGVVYWLPDLARWARAVARLTRPGGTFYLAEIHPFARIFDRGRSAMEPRIEHPYFARPAPLRFPNAGSYASRDGGATAVEAFYVWTHSLGDIVSSLCGAGLRVEFLHEFPFMVYQGLRFLERREDGLWWIPDEMGVELPLTFSIRAVRPAGG